MEALEGKISMWEQCSCLFGWWIPSLPWMRRKYGLLHQGLFFLWVCVTIWWLRCIVILLFFLIIFVVYHHSSFMYHLLFGHVKPLYVTSSFIVRLLFWYEKLYPGVMNHLKWIVICVLFFSSSLSTFINSCLVTNLTLENIRPNVKEPKINWNTKDMFCGLADSTDFLFRVKKLIRRLP